MKNSNKPIRVAQIMGKWVGGGVEAVIMNYYRHIDKSKVQFDFICDSDSTNIPYEEIEQLGGKVILCPPYQKITKYLKELKRIFKERNYKIVHSHINTLSVFPLYAAKKAGVKIRIAHSHATTNKKELKRHILKLILRPFSKIFATDYMCCSDIAGIWQFGKKTFKKNKVTKLHNAIDLTKFSYNIDSRKKIRKELSINDDCCVIGHVGRMVKTKNQMFIIDVFNEIQKENENSILIFVGQGPDYTELLDKVMNYNLENKVIFLGQRNDIYDVFQAFDIFLLPSLYEGLGMTLIEAQVSGLKCIASKNVPIESKITENVEYYDLDKGALFWAKKICLLDFKKRKNQIDSAKKSGYDIKIERKILEDFYEKMQERSVNEKN